MFACCQNSDLENRELHFQNQIFTFILVQRWPDIQWEWVSWCSTELCSRFKHCPYFRETCYFSSIHGSFFLLHVSSELFFFRPSGNKTLCLFPVVVLCQHVSTLLYKFFLHLWTIPCTVSRRKGRLWPGSQDQQPREHRLKKCLWVVQKPCILLPQLCPSSTSQLCKTVFVLSPRDQGQRWH